MNGLLQGDLLGRAIRLAIHVDEAPRGRDRGPGMRIGIGSLEPRRAAQPAPMPRSPEQPRRPRTGPESTSACRCLLLRGRRSSCDACGPGAPSRSSFVAASAKRPPSAPRLQATGAPRHHLSAAGSRRSTRNARSSAGSASPWKPRTPSMTARQVSSACPVQRARRWSPSSASSPIPLAARRLGVGQPVRVQDEPLAGPDLDGLRRQIEPAEDADERAAARDLGRLAAARPAPGSASRGRRWRT